jgi:hypothetical protein
MDVCLTYLLVFWLGGVLVHFLMFFDVDDLFYPSVLIRFGPWFWPVKVAILLLLLLCVLLWLVKEGAIAVYTCVAGLWRR